MVKTMLMAFAVVAAAAVADAQVITAVLDPYLKVHAALAQDKIDKADASAIVTEAAKLGDDGKAIASAARELEAAADIKTARKAFGDLSEALIAYDGKHKGSVPADLKLAYCPMQDRSWYQKGDTVANPFYGKEMPTCGQFKKR
jgi:hypothetical protein